MTEMDQLEQIARTLALADSQELIRQTSDDSQIGHASDAGWKDYLHMAQAVQNFLPDPHPMLQMGEDLR